MPPRILLVDDDVVLLDALSNTVKARLGGIVDTCPAADLAVDRMSTIDYDAIVSDIKMPGMDGLALMQQVLHRRPGTPTLLITGHGDRDLGIKALAAGAYAFIPKPIDRDFFLAWLKRAIELRHLTRTIEAQNQHLEQTVRERTEALEERHRELQAVLERERKLMAAGLALAESIDLDKTLARLADLMVPEHADWCLIDLIQERGSICKRVAVRTSRPDKEPYAVEFQQNYAPDLARPHPMLRAARTGQTDYDLDLGDDWIEPRARDARHAFLLAQMEATALIIVPLHMQGRVAGTFSLVASRWSGRRYTGEDVRFAEEIGRRASIALENAALHQRLRLELEERERTDEAVRRRTEELEATIRAVPSLSGSRMTRSAGW